MSTQVFGAGMLLLGVYFLVHHRRSRALAARARSWPSTPGEITRSEVRRGPGKRPSYRVRVTYRYTVDGVDHEGKAIALGGELQGGRKRAENRTEKYPVGSRPLVYYDPANPRQACLERVHEGGWLELLGAAFGISVGAGLLFGLLPPG